jgi:hypothetical protein
MKLTKTQLREIIREEIKFINETKKNSINERIDAKDGKIFLNGKLVGNYDYDRGSNSFWTTNLADKNLEGSVSFDTKEEMVKFYKKHIKNAPKALEKNKATLAKFAGYSFKP